MKNSTKIIIAVIIIVLVPLVYYVHRHVAKANETLVGCYVSRTDKNIYTLTIQSHGTTVVRGLLAYRNYQMDSSSGTFEGSYLNNMLKGDYSSRAEGQDFVREVIFKKDGDTFVQGIGEMQAEGNRQVFINAGDVSFEDGIVFKKDGSCNE